MQTSTTVRLFAVARQLAGAEEVQLEVPEPRTIAALRHALTTAYPQFIPFASQLMFAVNAQYAGDDVTIPPNAEVACIPPVSGG